MQYFSKNIKFLFNFYLYIGLFFNFKFLYLDKMQIICNCFRNACLKVKSIMKYTIMKFFLLKYLGDDNFTI